MIAGNGPNWFQDGSGGIGESWRCGRQRRMPVAIFILRISTIIASGRSHCRASGGRCARGLSFLASSGGVATDPQAVNVSSDLPGLRSWPARTVRGSKSRPRSHLRRDGIRLGRSNRPGSRTYQDTVGLEDLQASNVRYQVQVIVSSGCRGPSRSPDQRRIRPNIFADRRWCIPAANRSEVLNTGGDQVNFLYDSRVPQAGDSASCCRSGQRSQISPYQVGHNALIPSKFPRNEARLHCDPSAQSLIQSPTSP